MIRKKVKLAYITNDSSREATYKKIKKSLMKNMSELSTLCRSTLVLSCIVFMNPNSSLAIPYRSPTSAPQVKGVVHGLNVWDINDLNLLHDEKMSYFDKRMDAFAMTPLYAQGALSSLSSSMVALPPLTMVMPKVMPRTGTKDIVQLDVNNTDPMKRQQWIMELMKKKNNNNPQTHVGGNEMMFKFDGNINPNKCH
ncbi:hypothetical protein Golax_019743 [Gossypium laxum]|uniref:MADS-box domain-containing protein n=1 Tax=Gossypium laxum TaxID=34288 RepID=A0A7J8Z767_9ROSI|nr:hypothetical protein [Gossypium laxum]